jgi:hypothetical protein
LLSDGIAANCETVALLEQTTGRDRRLKRVVGGEEWIGGLRFLGGIQLQRQKTGKQETFGTHNDGRSFADLLGGCRESEVPKGGGGRAVVTFGT